MTPKGHKALDTELRLLKSVERPAIIKAIIQEVLVAPNLRTLNTTLLERNKVLLKAVLKSSNLPLAWQK